MISCPAWGNGPMALTVAAPITSPHADATRLLSGSGSGSRSVGSFMHALKRRLIKTIEITMILIIKGVGLKALLLKISY
jgi:hypothetical protein